MNTFKAVPDEIEKRLGVLMRKNHPMLVKARVRVDALFVTTDGEDGASLKYQGTPTSCLTKIVPQVHRVSSKADAQILIDRVDWDGCSKAQQEAMLDRALTFIEVKTKEDTIVLDGNDRPRLKLRKPDRMFAWFDSVAKRHGPASLEVQEAREIVANSVTYLPGFEFLEKEGRNNKSESKSTGKVVAMPPPSSKAAPVAGVPAAAAAK